MVATVIMAVAIVGLLSGISGALRNGARLTAYDRAVQLARWRMNELLVDQRLPQGPVISGAFDPEQTGGVEAGWRARLSTFEKPPGAGAGETALQRIELQIWWMAGSDRRTFTLDAFRPHVLTAEDAGPVAPQ